MIQFNLDISHALTKEECKEKLRAVPLGRFVKPIDVAEMTLFLVS